MIITDGTVQPDHAGDGPVGIVELGDWCARRRASFLDLFESLGAWATDATTAPGPLQQLWTTACHRHAWHAELCAERFPKVPTIDLDVLTENYRGRLEMPNSESRLPWYLLVIDGVLVACSTLRARLDPQLDPASVRLVDLVTFDLNDLRRHTTTLLNAPASHAEGHAEGHSASQPE